MTMNYVKEPTKRQKQLIHHANMLETAINNFINELPESRERSIALTEFQTALMWAGSSINRMPTEEESHGTTNT